ncbi:MAG: NADP-dependent malic enzyme [Gammaproteobacteria bacterium]|nr:NADP-dependent malic enzyme [Gammaproteobacteria bacterium]
MKDKLRDEALHYHNQPFPGKLAVVATKPMATQHDLALAYSPGVATPCEAIARDPAQAANFTSRSNLVAVVTNGTAVLGLGNIGPLAAKPVMEGKAILFKKFSGVDAFDIEVDELDPDMFIETVARLEPTFGGINLEDIKAPECFEIERKLRERMDIPVFHDDQHGTAIVVGAAVTNGLRVVGKDITTVKLVAAGGGAACLACLDLLVSMGLPRENITVVDLEGVINRRRAASVDKYKARYAQDTDARDLADVITGADIFLGLSAGGVLKAEMVKVMAENPLILALANPTPEIFPDEARAVRPDAILATGRSDYPNQVNNVLCFPFLFRGALDVVATDINEEMKKACVKAIADLACSEPSAEARNAYGGESLIFGPDYLIPKPFDSRLISEVAPAVAKAAMESGVATRPIDDLDTYKAGLRRFVFRSGTLMKPVFESARSQPKRVVYSDGEDERVLQAIQQATDEGIVTPTLVGRPEVIEDRIRRLGLRIKADHEFEIINPASDARYKEYWETFHSLLGRRGVSVEQARTVVRTSNTVIACLTVKLGYADALLCGAVGRFNNHLHHVLSVIGRAQGVHRCAAMSGLVLPNGTFFICDTHVMPEPSAEEIAQIAILCAEQVRRFGVAPKVALLSYSNFGTSDLPSPRKMRRAREILEREAPDLEVDGEMHADSALSERIREKLFLGSKLQGQANLLVMPNLDAAHITFETLKVLGGGVPVGPILVGSSLPAHIMSPSITVRGLMNLTALAVADAQSRAQDSAAVGAAS